MKLFIIPRIPQKGNLKRQGAPCLFFIAGLSPADRVLSLSRTAPLPLSRCRLL